MAVKVWERLQRTVDRAIGLISPRTAARRAHFRRMADDPAYRQATLLWMHAAGYRAADDAATKTGWAAGGASADVHLCQSLDGLRNRSRELNRDDPLASGLVDTFVSNVVGCGLRPQAKTRRPEINEALEEVWTERSRNLFPAERLSERRVQALIMSSYLTDGGVFINQRKPARETPLAFELVEGERVATPWGSGGAPQLADPQGTIVDGVEKDRNGVPVAYHVMRWIPSDVINRPSELGVFRRVPTWACYHFRRCRRPGQTREEPWFHAVLQDLRDLDLLLTASLKRMELAACLAAFIRSPNAMTDIVPATAETYGYKLDQTLEPGMIFKLNPEEDLSTVVPNFPTPELVPFVICFARRIGAALGVSWQIVLKDFSTSTYSSARTDLLEARIVYRVLRADFAELMSWIWRAVMEDARLRGDERLRGVSNAEIARVEWIGDGWSWVDPLKEVQATQIAVEAGFKTLRRVWIELGYDPDEMEIEVARDRAWRREQGMIGEVPAALVQPPRANGNGTGRGGRNGNAGQRGKRLAAAEEAN